MGPSKEDVDAFVRALDRLLFHGRDSEEPLPEGQNPALTLTGYLMESFPRMTVAEDRRERLQRRLIRRLGIPANPSPGAWERFETELNRRVSSLDPRWTRFAGPAALVLVGLLGVAYWRQRSGIRALPVGLR